MSIYILQINLKQFCINEFSTKSSNYLSTCLNLLGKVAQSNEIN